MNTHKSSGQPGCLPPAVRTAVVILFWLALIVLCFVYRDEITVERIVNLSPKSLAAAAVILLLLFALKSVTVVVYSGILYAASGILFPLPAALAVNLLGAAVMVSLPFFIGRAAGASALQRLSLKHEKLALLRDIQSHNEFFVSFFVRIVGLLPADLVSVYLGASGFRYKRYILSSLCGLAPTIVSLSVMGTSIEDPTSPAFLISAGAEAGLMLLSIILFLLWKRRKRLAPRHSKFKERKKEVH